jgi:predicted AlkP superfamily phosphohydrolase/phosphomutase
MARRGEQARRLVMVSYDGTGADLAWEWIDQDVASDPDGLTAMARHGFSVRRVRSVNPTLTAVNHASLITARQPSETGIVCNWFRPAGQSINTSASGFNTTMEARTLWQAAHAQGKRVGIISWAAGAVGTYADTELGALWPVTPVTRSTLLELDPEQAGTTGEVPSEDGVQPLLWHLTVKLEGAEPDTITALVVAFDANPDGRPRFDMVAVRMADATSWTYLEERGWFPVEGMVMAGDDTRAHRYGAWCKALHIDRRSGRLKLLQGSVYRLLGYPDSFVAEMEAAVGFWPGPPDGWLLSDWWLDGSQGIDLDTYLEQLKRLDRYLDRLTAAVLASYELDLLLAYHPGPDEYQHSSLIEDPRQWAYSPGRALAAREGLKQVGESVDRSVGDLWRLLDPARDALVVVSDHGLAPLHDMVNINQALANAGLVEIEPGKRPRVADDTPMKAVTSGGCAHIYLNLKGRDPGGVVEPEQANDLLRRAARALADIEGDSGAVVEQIFTRKQAAAIGLEHPNSGDLIAFLQPGYTTSAQVGSEKLIEPTSYYAQHGHLNHHDRLCGMMFARGAGVPKNKRKEIHATTVAHLVASWLGIDFEAGPSGGSHDR